MISSSLVSTNGFIILAMPVAIAAALLRTVQVRNGWWPLVVRVALAIYLVVLIGLVFFPLPLPPWHVSEFGAIPLLGPWPAPWASIVPFDTIGTALRLGPDWPQFWTLLGNLAAFFPMGVFVGAFWPARRSWRRAFVVGLVATVGIELTQLGISLLMSYPYRVADIDDVIVNLAGALLGYGAFLAADRLGRAILPMRLVFWRSSGPTDS